MSDIIQVLPDSVANQIAAGEVVQRPSNVVKELVENAIDAGATSIKVVVTDAGRTAIRVIDNGKGMSETDARLSFERHATSKIRKASDLFSLTTMGFRGEALASIAAVAQVELRTRQATDEIGTTLSIHGSRFIEQKSCACPIGSDFNVQNLFYNVPARRKFLKSETTERNNIIAAFQRIALVYPAISFTLQNNGVDIFSLHAATLKQRIVDIFGKKMDQDLLPVSIETTLCKVEGFVGKPESAHKKGVHQYFFANKRFMKHPYFHKAVTEAFDRLVPIGETIPYFLYFDVDPENIDVNINPTKTEIKFENEQAIWQILSSGIREAVGLNTEIPTLDFDNEDKPDIPVFDPNNNLTMPKEYVDKNFNPFSTSTKADRISSKWQDLYPIDRSTKSEPSPDIFPSNTPDEQYDDDNQTTLEPSPIHYQYKGRYIMTAVKSGLMIIDQHRAHMRILYEQYLQQASQQKVPSEKLMFPETVTFSASEQDAYDSMSESFASIGFELMPLGSGVYAINSVPVGVSATNATIIIREIIASIVESGATAISDINKKMAHTMAKNTAIDYGEVMNNNEMDTLINQLFACKNANYTPDGQSIMCILKQKDIEHLLE